MQTASDWSRDAAGPDLADSGRTSALCPFETGDGFDVRRIGKEIEGVER